jgi:probable rRNA maturation factor
MIDLDNKTDIKIDIKSLDLIAQSLTNKEIELIICDNSYIQELNKIHRDKNMPTDVLSFPLLDSFIGLPLGSVVINFDKAQEVALNLGHKDNEEIALLFIHGVLHLLGYNHEIDSGEMRQKERELIETFKLPDSLIIRLNG